MNQADDLSPPQLPRRFPRKAFRSMVAVLHHGKIHYEASTQISEGGIQLRTPKPYAWGETIGLNLMLPGGLWLASEGVVVYVVTGKDTVLIGIRFLNPSPGMRARIRGFVTFNL